MPPRRSLRPSSTSCVSASSRRAELPGSVAGGQVAPIGVVRLLAGEGGAEDADEPQRLEDADRVPVLLRRVDGSRTDAMDGAGIALAELGRALDHEAGLVVMLVPEV